MLLYSNPCVKATPSVILIHSPPPHWELSLSHFFMPIVTKRCLSRRNGAYFCRSPKLGRLVPQGTASVLWKERILPWHFQIFQTGTTRTRVPPAVQPTNQGKHLLHAVQPTSRRKHLLPVVHQTSRRKSHPHVGRPVVPETSSLCCQCPCTPPLVSKSQEMRRHG